MRKISPLVLTFGVAMSLSSQASSLICHSDGGKVIFHEWTLTSGTQPPSGKLNSVRRLFVQNKLVGFDEGFVGKAPAQQSFQVAMGEKQSIVAQGKIPGPVLTVYTSEATLTWKKAASQEDDESNEAQEGEEKTKTLSLKTRLECTDHHAGFPPSPNPGK